MPLSSRTAIASALLFLASVGRAQQRPVDRLADERPEAQLMGYYSAVMHFAPIGFADPELRIEVGGDATYLPNLSAEDQKVGFNGAKAENTNFCPVFPRLRGSLSAGSWAFEAAYLPPLRVCGVEPHMFSAAIARTLPLSPRWNAVLRASGHYGTLRAAITCNEDAVADPSNTLCFDGTESEDTYRPFILALEGALAYQGWWSERGLAPYVLVGVRREDFRFDVGFVDSAGVLDNTRLLAGLTRAHFAVGTTWAAGRRVRLGGELFYAPRALLSLRGRVSIALKEAT
jgi:hypothetical protein